MSKEVSQALVLLVDDDMKRLTRWNIEEEKGLARREKLKLNSMEKQGCMNDT